MDRLRRTLSFRHRRKKKSAREVTGTTEANKPHQWQEDERKVREGTCSFQVKYLGCVEVFESRGMVICEEAVKSLRSRGKGKYQRAVLYVSGDALRVVDEMSKVKTIKGLIVDQTIEKVSFCAPDRNQEKGFAYICRDGTTRRWMCHGFLALKESGERLSHAVGCAFAICLEKKQKREKDAVNVTFSEDKTTFTRLGSFRQATLTERMVDPQSAKIAEPLPSALPAAGGVGAALPEAAAGGEVAAVERPHATPNMLLRQGSFREFSKLNSAQSPFKRNLSLRLNELPSNLRRQEDGAGVTNGIHSAMGGVNGSVAGGTIPEMSPTSAIDEFDPIANMCKELTQGLSSLSETQQLQNNLSAGGGGPTGSVTNPWERPTGGSTTAAAPGPSLTGDFWMPQTSQQQTIPQQQQQPMNIGMQAHGSFQPAAGMYHQQQPLMAAKPTFAVPNVPNGAAINRPTPMNGHQGVVHSNNMATSSNMAAVSNMGAMPSAASADPFDAAWAMRSAGGGMSNPFVAPNIPAQAMQGAVSVHNGTNMSAPSGGNGTVTKSFEMRL